MDSSVPLLSSASRKSSSSVLPRRPPKMNTYGPTAATACRHRRVTSSLLAPAATGVHHTPAACAPAVAPGTVPRARPGTYLTDRR